MWLFLCLSSVAIYYDNTNFCGESSRDEDAAQLLATQVTKRVPDLYIHGWQYDLLYSPHRE